MPTDYIPNGYQTLPNALSFGESLNRLISFLPDGRVVFVANSTTTPIEAIIWAADGTVSIPGITSTIQSYTLATLPATHSVGALAWVTDGPPVGIYFDNGTAWNPIMTLPVKFYTFAGLPTAGTIGRIAAVSNNRGGLWLDNGVQWRPLSHFIDVTQYPYNVKPDGVTDFTAEVNAAIVAIQAAGGGIVYCPAGSYKFTSKIIINAVTGGVANATIHLMGAGMGATIFNSAVVGDYAITFVGATPFPFFTAEASGFSLLGNSTNDAGGDGTGGILFDNIEYARGSHLRVENFSTGGWATAGTESRPGIHVRDCVGQVLDYCYAQRNDIGFLFNVNVQSIQTATKVMNCSSRLNRTNGISVANNMTFWWDGGTVESNNANVSVVVTGANTPNSIRFSNMHFEGNQRVVAVGASGSREFLIDLTGLANGNITLDNIEFNTGAGRPEYDVELSNSLNSVIMNCNLASGVTGAALINSSAVNTAIVNPKGGIITDNGLGSIHTGPAMGIGTIKALGAGNSVRSLSVVNLAGGGATHGALTGGFPGQVLDALVPAGGTVLSSTSNFILPGGALVLALLEGTWVKLYCVDGTSWRVSHVSDATTNATTLADGATIFPFGKVAYIGDASTTPITTISTARSTNNQSLTLISSHTGANTTTIKHGTGNIFLAAGVDFTLGINKAITLYYVASANKWIQPS